MLKPYLITILIMSIITLLVYVRDYSIAKNSAGCVRIPEYVLLMLTALGGGAGALIASLTTRHKTRKLSFKIVIACSIIVEAVTVFLLLR